MKAWQFAAIGIGLLVLYNGKKIVSTIRGIRNKNPGNLVITDIQWKGKVPRAQNTDGKFEQFRDTDGVPGEIWGIRALLLDAKTDITTHGLNTIRKLITEYAPSAENDTTAYIASVSQKTGKKPDDILIQADITALAKAVIAHENLNYSYPDSYYSKALQLS